MRPAFSQNRFAPFRCVILIALAVVSSGPVCVADTEEWREPSLEWLADVSDAIVVAEITPQAEDDGYSTANCRITRIVIPENENNLEVGQTLRFTKRTAISYNYYGSFTEGDVVLLFLRTDQDGESSVFHHINATRPRTMINKEPVPGEFVRPIRLLGIDKRGNLYENADAILGVIADRIEEGRTVPDDCDYSAVEHGNSVNGGFYRWRPGPEFDSGGYDVVIRILLPPDPEFRMMIESSMDAGFGISYGTRFRSILRENYPCETRDADRNGMDHSLYSPNAVQNAMEAIRNSSNGTPVFLSHTTQPRSDESDRYGSSIRQYRVSPCGKYWLSGFPPLYPSETAEPSFQLIDASNGLIIFDAEGNFTRFSSDGRHLSWRQDEPQKVFALDIASREIILDKNGLEIDFSPNGRFLYWTSPQGRSRFLFDTEKHKVILKFNMTRYGGPQFSPDDRNIGFFTEPTEGAFLRLTVWDLESERQLASGEIHEQRCMIEPFPNSSYLLLLGDYYHPEETRRRFLLNWETGEIDYTFPAKSGLFAVGPDDATVAYVDQTDDAGFTLHIESIENKIVLKELDLPGRPDRLEFLSEGAIIMAVFTPEPSEPDRKSALLYSVHSDEVHGELLVWTERK